MQPAAEGATVRLVRVALGAVMTLWLTACGDGAERAVIGSSGSTSTEPTTTLAPTTTDAPTTTGPSTTVARTVTTIGVPTTRRTTTTRAPATTVTTGATVPCSAAQLTVEVTTDKATYRPGETVRILGTLRNRSGATCTYSSYTGSHQIDGPSGQTVRPGAVFIADAFRETPLPAAATLTQSPTWDQGVCAATPPPCPQAPLGTYTARVAWGFAGPPVEGSATFQLVAA